MCVAAALIDGLCSAAIVAQVLPFLFRKVIFRFITWPKDLQASLLAFLILNVVLFDELMGLHQVSMLDLV